MFIPWPWWRGTKRRRMILWTHDSACTERHMTLVSERNTVHTLIPCMAILKADLKKGGPWFLSHRCWLLLSLTAFSSLRRLGRQCWLLWPAIDGFQLVLIRWGAGVDFVTIDGAYAGMAGVLFFSFFFLFFFGILFLFYLFFHFSARNQVSICVYRLHFTNTIQTL